MAHTNLKWQKDEEEKSFIHLMASATATVLVCLEEEQEDQMTFLRENKGIHPSIQTRPD